MTTLLTCLGILWLVCFLWVLLDWLVEERSSVLLAEESTFHRIALRWYWFSRDYSWFVAVLLTGPLGFLAYGAVRELKRELRNTMRS